MRHSRKVGVSFGLTSGVITTLGLIVGLDSGTHSRAVVLGGIITIAIADAFSDALGIHMSEESENKHTAREIWESTIATFLSKFVIAMTFLVPMVLFQLSTAVIVSVAWGLFILTMMSLHMAKSEKANRWHVICEHLVIAIVVVIITHFVGDWVGKIFV